SPQDAVRAAGRPRAGPRASEASNPEVAPAKPALERRLVRRGPSVVPKSLIPGSSGLNPSSLTARVLDSVRRHGLLQGGETVLMRLLEGAGPRGLAGIAPARGVFIRPLLETRREEILAHLASRGLGWVEDVTNRDPRFLRNRMRHDVLPFLGHAFGPGVVESLCRSATLSRGLVADLERQARSELGRVATRGASGVVFPVAEL